MRICISKAKESNPSASYVSRKAKNDITFIAVLLLLVSVAALALFLFRTPGDKVVINVDGKVWGEYLLNEDKTVEIMNGDGYNLLVIEGGKAYVKQASCPDGICAAHRPIEYNGESIICLPNKVVIEVHSQNEKMPDIIA